MEKVWRNAEKKASCKRGAKRGQFQETAGQKGEKMGGAVWLPPVRPSVGVKRICPENAPYGQNAECSLHRILTEHKRN